MRVCTRACVRVCNDVINEEPKLMEEIRDKQLLSYDEIINLFSSFTSPVLSLSFPPPPRPPSPHSSPPQLQLLFTTLLLMLLLLLQPNIARGFAVTQMDNLDDDNDSALVPDSSLMTSLSSSEP